MTDENRISAFPPIIGREVRTLILGTMPGGKSLEAREYYAHPQNQFWRLMGDIYGAFPNLPYQQRIEILLSNRIGVWDVLKTCRRRGSMDADIKDETVHNFEIFFNDYPSIARVVFDSGKAEQSYHRHALPGLPKTGLEYHRVPSPSPAYARMCYEDKLKIWKHTLL